MNKFLSRLLVKLIGEPIRQGLAVHWRTSPITYNLEFEIRLFGWLISAKEFRESRDGTLHLEEVNYEPRKYKPVN